MKDPKQILAERAPRLASKLVDMKRRYNKARSRKMSDFHVDGIRLPHDRQIISEKIALAIVEGWYELEERENLPGLIEDGDVVLELGTGLGLVSSLCAKDERVHFVVTVEANPALVKYARKVHRLNQVPRRVCQVHAIALPDPDVESLDFFVRDDVWASSTNGEVWGWSEKIRTRVTDLNQLVRDTQPTLLIVDIEGGEEALFDGFDPGTVRTIYMEVHEQVIGQHGIDRIHGQLEALGFAFVPAQSGGGVVTFRRDDAPARTQPEKPPQAFIKGRLVYGATPTVNEEGEPDWAPTTLRLRGTPNNNLLYVLNAKSACTTFLNFLVALEQGQLMQDELDVHFAPPGDLLNWRDHRVQLEPILLGPDPFLFTFLRNPHRRLQSGFFDKIVATHDQHYAPVRARLQEDWNLPAQIDEHNVSEALDRFLVFLEETYAEDPARQARDPHFNNQWLNISFDEVPFDFIGRVEHIKEDLETVLSHSRLKTDIASLFDRKFNTTTHPLYRGYTMTGEQWERVAALYAGDYERFSDFYTLEQPERS